MEAAKKTILITGANGFIGSEIVRQLLTKSYNVIGTVRDPTDTAKVAHLKKFADELPGKLTLVAGDLLKSESFDESVKQADIVLHTASPLGWGKSKDEIVTPAIEGTKSVFDSIERVGSKVTTVVLTSSIASISSNAGTVDASHVYSEKDWSPVDVLKEKEAWYPLSKTLAEKSAWEHPIVKGNKVKLVVVCPAWTIGAISSKRHISSTPGKWHRIVTGQMKIPNACNGYSPVADVARAHIKGFEDPSAEGRYALVASSSRYPKMVETVKAFGLTPNLATEVEETRYEPDKWDCSKAEKFLGGWQKEEEVLREMVESFKALGLLDKE